MAYTCEQLEAMSDAQLIALACTVIDMPRKSLRRKSRKWLIDTIILVTSPVNWRK